MAAFPASPVAPAAFLEEWLPQAFAEAGPMPGAEDVDVKLGIQLEGEGGGEWVVHVERGQVSVASGGRAETAFTYVQSVADWQGALWDGAGGAIGKGASMFFRPDALREAGSGESQLGQLGGAPSPKALEQMQALSGLIRMVVGGDEPWSVGFCLGTGPVPDDATTTVKISSEDAAAMDGGELDPMTAFMSGKIQVEGDMTLMMQMQAIQMQVAQEQQQGGGGGGA